MHRCHCDFEEICIRRIGEVRVDLSAWTPVQSHEFIHEISACLFPVGGIALEIGKAAFGDWNRSDFRLEEIHLVQEKNQCRVFEPMRVSN